MPIFTVYAKIIRKGKRRHAIRNAPILQIYEQPVDWPDLKRVMLDTARKIHFEFEQEVSEIRLDRHLSGKYIRSSTGYRTSRTRIGRQPEFMARITYLKGQDEVRIEKPTFIQPWTWDLKQEYYAEIGKKWEIPKVVPAGFEASLQNPKIMENHLLTLKTSSYATQPRNLYGSAQTRHHQTGPYAAASKGLYAGRNQSTIEFDKQQRENEI